MTFSINSHRTVLVFGLIIASLFLLTQCIGGDQPAEQPVTNAKGQVFAGSAACMQCHREIYDSNIHTAHYLTSRPASAEYIKGSFEEGKNSFAFNPYVQVTAEKTDSGFYQVEYVNGTETKRVRFDIVTGSGKRGQTYLYWNDSKLYQLPLFYFTAKNEWANSPGYPGKVVFSRPITSRCLECHSTYVQKTSDAITEPEEFNRRQIIYGVDCEKCHGPGQEHVSYQLANPNATTAKYIINPASLSRKQNLNLCALCHGGRLMKTKASFSFGPGDTLSNYFRIDIDTLGQDAADIDVHGNQYGLLAASKCFKMSTMTCSTCHSPHVNQTGQTQVFSAKCMTCHNAANHNFCTEKDLPPAVLQQNCIDCHMPEQLSKAIVFLEQGSNTPAKASMRSHYIRIYPDIASHIVAEMKGQKGKNAK